MLSLQLWPPPPPLLALLPFLISASRPHLYHHLHPEDYPIMRNRTELEEQICNRLSRYVSTTFAFPQLPNPVSPDQAVKSLCEIWRPQDVPNVFLTSSRATVGSELPPPAPKSRTRNTQLPSPVSLLTQPSPPSPQSSSSPAARVGPVTLQCEQDLAANFGNRTNLVPIKGFVHEVLRRSRTSGSVLQMALCYLEAIRPKVPELIRKEQSGEGTGTEYDSESRVTPATAAELALEAQLSSMNFDFTVANPNDEGHSARLVRGRSLHGYPVVNLHFGRSDRTEPREFYQRLLHRPPPVPPPLPQAGVPHVPDPGLQFHAGQMLFESRLGSPICCGLHVKHRTRSQMEDEGTIATGNTDVEDPQQAADYFDSMPAAIAGDSSSSSRTCLPPQDRAARERLTFVQ
ncbi:hypothetical protein B0H16DRAFT_1715357 [Mycena metata]|uniref:Uncharacterized protein n=1 Tax=Mycena metata TaxID=1033252 RepID=A0AAD7JSH2_9AGAR|nr:hypothetical protein B0H16DRAFT_1715357 [Mycena metata]